MRTTVGGYRIRVSSKRALALIAEKGLLGAADELADHAAAHGADRARVWPVLFGLLEDLDDAQGVLAELSAGALREAA